MPLPDCRDWPSQVLFAARLHALRLLARAPPALLRTGAAALATTQVGLHGSGMYFGKRRVRPARHHVAGSPALQAAFGHAHTLGFGNTSGTVVSTFDFLFDFESSTPRLLNQ